MEPKYPWAEYQFEIHLRETPNWPDTGGVYVFAKSIPDVPGALFNPHTTWNALYIGQTESFSNRIHDDHEKWMDALDRGFSYVHILRVDDPELRESIEALLIDRYQPRLNIQQK